MAEAAWSIDSLPDAFAPITPPPKIEPKPGKGDRIDAVEHGGRPVVNLYQPQSGTEKWSIDHLPDYDFKTDTQEHQVGVGEAAGRGALDAATFGTAPAIAGLSAAGATGEQLPMVGEFPGLEIPAQGAARITRGDEEARKAAEKERSDFEAKQRAAQEQRPVAFGAGELAGSLATPGFGAATAGALPARIASGAIAGGVGGALYGAGSTVGKGGGASEAVGGALRGATMGVPTGGLLKGAIGPRAPSAAITAGENAARKGAEIGAELPRGFTGGPFKAATTAALQSSPFSGQLITNRVKKFGEKFGEHVADIGGEMGGGSGRSGADIVARHGLQNVIDNNKDVIKESYKPIDAVINPDQPYTMPRLDAVLDRIMKARANAHWDDPAEGLGQFRRAAAGTTFQGARDVRSDAYRGGSLGKQHPTYDKRQYDAIRRAITEDMREMVAHAGGTQAVAKFDKVEKQFGILADQNNILDDLIKAKGEGAISHLLNAAKEKGGNLSLLAQLRHSMSPEEFSVIGGTLLNELGKAGPAGEFSPARFATDWGKLSEGARRTLFSSSHAKDIDELVGSAKHLTKALERSNRSHTTGALLVFDTLKTIAEFGIAVGAGAVDPTAGLVTGAGVGASHLLTVWLASPSKAAAMRAWGNSYRGVIDSPNPARIAAFKIATRNLSNNLGVSVEQIAGAIKAKSNEEPATNQQ